MKLLTPNESSGQTSRILLAALVVGGIIALIALIMAEVALARPTASMTDDASESGSSGNAAGLVVNCYNGGASVDVDDKKRVYTIAVGHDWGAYEYIDTNGYLAGFHHDIINAVCSAAGIDCRTVWEPYTNCFDSEAGEHPRGGQALMDRWVDACGGWAVTVTRSQIAKFTQSFLKTEETKFHVKVSDTSFDPKSFKGKKIGFVDGWAYDEKCLARKTGIVLAKENIKHYAGTVALKNAITNGEVDAGFMATPYLRMYVEGGSPSIKTVGSHVECLIRGDAMATRKDSDFAEKWNEGFSKIVSNGVFAKMCKDAESAHNSDNKGTIMCVN